MKSEKWFVPIIAEHFQWFDSSAIYVSFDQIWLYIFNGKWGLSKFRRPLFWLLFFYPSNVSQAIIKILAKTLNVVGICLIAAKLLVFFFFSHSFHFLFTRSFWIMGWEVLTCYLSFSMCDFIRYLNNNDNDA